MATKDPIVARLEAVTQRRAGGVGLRVLDLFGDRPDVLEAIRVARRDHRLSYKQIAELVSTDTDTISDEAISTWLNRQGIR